MAGFRLRSGIVRAAVHGGPVLFDLDGGAWAALDPSAERFLQELEVGVTHSLHVTGEEKELLSVLLRLGLAEETGAIDAEPLSPTSLPERLPQTAYVHTSFRCNLSCRTCYSFDQRRNRCRDLTTEQMLSVLRKLREAGVHEIVFSGGEPFLRDDMVQLLAYCKQTLGCSRIVVITNGTLLEQALVDELTDIVDEVAVSLDGYNEETNARIRGRGNFAKALGGLQRLQARGIPSHIITTLHGGNVRELQRYLEFAEKLGVHINFSAFTPFGKGAGRAGSLHLSATDLAFVGKTLAAHPGNVSVSETACVEGLRARARCGMGTELISVQADGTVYPCHITMIPELEMGDLLEQDLTTILASSPVAAQCRKLSVESLPSCSACQYRFFCGGGCRANALYSQGSLTAHDPHCELSKTFLRCAVANAMGPDFEQTE